MKALFELLATICFFLSAIFFSACKNSVDEKSYEEMILTFNQKYFSSEPVYYEPYSVNSPDFNPKEMLAPSYVFLEDSYVNLSAPENCTTYSWETFDSNGNKIYSSTKSFFYCEASTAFKTGEENSLILTVTIANGEGKSTEYIDESVIILRGQKHLDSKE